VWTLAGLHAILQTVMAWFDSHLHEFEIDMFHYGVPDDEWDTGEDLLDEAKVRLDTVRRRGHNDPPHL
jgi:hypothetical protein